MVLKGSDDTDGMVFSLSNGPTGTMWWEIDGESKLILNGDNFGIGLNNNGTELPTNTLHVNGSFGLENGTEQSNYVLTSNSLGVGTWQPISGLTTGLTLSEVLSNGNTTGTNHIVLSDGNNSTIQTPNGLNRIAMFDGGIVDGGIGLICEEGNFYNTLYV
jgi:hypothetical protein